MRKITRLSTDTRNARKQRNGLFKALKGKKKARLEFNSEKKLSFKNKGTIKTFPDKHILRKCVASRLTPPEMRLSRMKENYSRWMYASSRRNKQH